MARTTEVAVTLTQEWFERLKAEAHELGLPIEWLVASLLADAMDTTVPEVQSA